MKTDELFAQITDTLIAKMEAGVTPWNKPWSASTASPHNLSGRNYRGANAFWLDMLRDMRGYTSPVWMTYNQASAAGGSVKKGEKGTCVFFWNFTEKANATTGKVEKMVWAKAYTVFNLDQTENVRHKAIDPLAQPSVFERNDAADALVVATGAVITHGGDRACYVPSADVIRMPVKEAFTGSDAYYSTLFHEIGHWTGSDKRLKREFGKRFGDMAYAAEELVAELTAAYVCAALGFDNPARDDHAAYLQAWIKVLKADPKAFITAAGKAQAAADFILSSQAEEEEALAA
jgi:antirestriction protein ArdC